MTLSETIAERQSRRASRVNRDHQDRAELRMDEIVSVEGIADDYLEADRGGDLEIERHFRSLYALVNSADEKAAVAAAYAVWVRTERNEEQHVTGSVFESVSQMKRNNPVWIDGAAVPPDSERGA